MSLYDAARPTLTGFREVGVAEVPVPPPAGLKIIDVREPSEFTGELGHIPGAALVPLGSFEAAARTWDKSLEYVLVCKSGGRSGQASMVLARAGFGRVMNLVGGMLAWNSAGRATEK
jgi:rhodanese-related sulfurtransferase